MAFFFFFRIDNKDKNFWQVELLRLLCWIIQLKNMSKIFCVLSLIACFTLVAYAQEETGPAEQQGTEQCAEMANVVSISDTYFGRNSNY